MTIVKNWQKLYKFWKELDFEKLKACDLALKKVLDEDSIYNKDEIDILKQQILDWSLIKIKFNPATNKDIKYLEKKLNVILSNDFKESLEINVGDIYQNEYIYSWLGNWHHMLSIEDMIKYTLNKREYYLIEKKTKSFEYINDLPNEYSYWNKKWLIFYDYNQDEQYIVNLDNSSLFYGEILEVSMEFSTIRRLANSYMEWFNIATKERLTYGEILFI